MREDYHLERGAELKKFRMKLLDRWMTLRFVHGGNVPFDQVWYEFLTRHFIEEHPREQIYDDLCKELGVTLTCNAWITRIKAQQGKLLAADICPSLFWLQKGIALPHET